MEEHSFSSAGPAGASGGFARVECGPIRVDEDAAETENEIEGEIESEIESEIETGDEFDQGIGGEVNGDRRSMPMVQLLPNLVTLLGLCAGLTAIRFSLQDAYEAAAALIVLAALIDGMDGLLARKLNAVSSFGGELDSLSDFVCFGVAPGLFVYHFALHALPALGWLAVLVFVLSACLRLARFNVARAVAAGSGKAHFVGVPAPAGAMLGLLPVYLTLSGWFDAGEWPVLVAGYVACVGLMMISRLRTPSLKSLRVPRRAAVPVMLAVTMLAGALVIKPWTVLVTVDLVYLAVLGWAGWRRWRPRLVPRS